MLKSLLDSLAYAPELPVSLVFPPDTCINEDAKLMIIASIASTSSIVPHIAIKGTLMTS